MSMNELLANYYGTNGGGQAEELEKQAQVELFAKLASDNGIDLNELNDDQVQGLWDSTFKTAGEDDEEDEKKKKAKEEFAEKKESADKLAEADFLGRTMAHAYVDELNKIGAKAPEPGMLSRAWDATKHHVTDAAKATSVREGLAKRKALKEFAGSPGFDKVRGEANKEIAKGVAKTVGLYGGGAAAIGLGGKKIHDSLKEGSALDAIAAELAVEKAAEAGFNAEEAAQRVDALLTLGAGDSEKVAAAGDFNEAVDVRSLELLEGAGYPVEWSKEAGRASDAANAVGRFAKKVTGYSDIRGGLKGRRTAERSLVGGVSGPVREGGKRVKDKNAITAGKHHATKRLAKGVGKAGLTLGVTGVAANEAHKRASDEAADVNDYIFDLAVEKAASAGFNADEAADRIDAVMTLGLEESEKVAAAQDIDSAVEIRSLEVLEAAGYPIEWA
jgi:hypothetical protein